MKIKTIDKFKALGVTALGMTLVAAPFVFPEALPTIPLALGGFVLSAKYANEKLTGEKIETVDINQDHAFSNHGISKEDAIESMLAIRVASADNLAKNRNTAKNSC